MKWFVFVLALLLFCAFPCTSHAKEARVLALDQSEVAQVKTALAPYVRKDVVSEMLI